MENINNKKLLCQNVYVSMPVILNEEEKELCQKLDYFYKYYNLKTKPSDLYQGAIFVLRDELKNNPDRFAQAAHSLREILYPFFSKQVHIVKFKKTQAFEKFGSVGFNLLKKSDLGRLYGKLQNIAHHRLIVNNFKEIIEDFIKVINIALASQIDVHKIIKKYLEKSPYEYIKNNQILKEKVLVNEIKNLISLNFDSKNFFFSSVDKNWLNFLWKNGFLDFIQKKVENRDSFSYKTPELNYLVRMADEEPDLVFKIIKEVKISEKNFNPEVIARFVEIIAKLPAKFSSQLIEKIKNEKWFYLMRNFSLDFLFSFEIEKILENLYKNNYYKQIITLAESILIIKKKESNKNQIFRIDKPFYFGQVSTTKIFEYLAKLDFNLFENILNTLVKVFNSLVDFYDGDISLYDVNLFELKIESEKDGYFSDVKNLIACILSILEKIIGEKDEVKINNFYKKYLIQLKGKTIGDRIRFFYISKTINFLDEGFYEEILYNLKQKKDLTIFPEFQIFLKESFKNLTSQLKEKIKSIIKKFAQENQKEIAYELANCIIQNLTNEEISNLENLIGRKLIKDYKPQPLIGETKAFINNLIPKEKFIITYDNFKKFSINELALNFSQKWNLENLPNKGDDLEILRSLLRKDIKERFYDYFNNLYLFSQNNIEWHYLYEIFFSFEEEIKNNNQIDYLKLKIKSFFENINELLKKTLTKKDYEAKEKEAFYQWLAGKRSVAYQISRILKEILKKQNSYINSEIKNSRNLFLELIKNLFKHNDPKKEDEILKQSQLVTTYQGIKKVSNPFFIGINSVRGHALEILINFAYVIDKELKDDIKEIFKSIIKKEKTKAMYSLFGYYLPYFYFNDKNWIKLILKKYILKAEKKMILAFWEGYLSQNLYEEIFFDEDFKKLYYEAINFTQKIDPEREFHKDPEEGLGHHLALAYIYFKRFNLNFFSEFWKKLSDNHKIAIIDFIGAYFINSDDQKLKEIKRNQKIVEKLRKLWEFVLEENENSLIYQNFDRWIDLNFFSIDFLVDLILKTLEKANGILNTHYLLVEFLPKFAENNPKKTLEIINLFLIKNQKNINYFYNKEQLEEALKIIYCHKKSKKKVEETISKLIQIYSSIFWDLKKVIKECQNLTKQ